ncbi:MAG TPA: carcinine hydrolase/isopenicillin-N N-acyltransferase family protein [Candidatus Wallbacteria bacterium]|nr:carcinine hydrolase/isopenicillin-N N-acyltransferase family protein [Candidatus Wallbacteria bacterium]
MKHELRTSVTKFFLCAFIFISFAIIIIPRHAAASEDECTLIGLAGYSARGGGSIVLKNRDRNSRFIQSLDFVRTEGGYFFIGVKNISAVEKDPLAYTMGINEKGLICVSSSPPNKINFDFRGRPYKVYHPGRILSAVASVDEFIEKVLKAGRLGSAMNYIVADAKKMCLVETVDEMHYDYKIIINGALCQTNHYHLEPMVKYQGLPVNKSTASRLERARLLAGGGLKTLGATDLMAVSSDHGASEEYNDFNICRHPDLDYGSAKFDGGTISAMVLVSRAGEPPCAYVSVGQPCVAGYKKLLIKEGTCVIDPALRFLYSTGVYNAFSDFKRDAYYHFMKPFVSKH